MDRYIKSSSDKKSPAAVRMPAMGSHVTAACKSIVRLICSHGLAVGDSLPSQRELRSTLGFSNITLSASMRLLMDMGLITRRVRHGTQILSLEPMKHLTWDIGLAWIDFPEQGPGAGDTFLLHALLSRLSRMNCSCHTYFRVEKPHWPHHLEDFPGLQDDVATRALDGLITLTALDSTEKAACDNSGIPLLNVGRSKEMPFATVLNYRGMITDAVAVLLQRGASKLALVGEAIDAQAFDTLVRQTARTSDRNSVSTEQIKHDRAIEGGIRVADQIAARSSKQRPDALIFLDDFVAAGATHKWASIGNYAPKIAVITSKQIPQTWSLPVLRFETDIEEFADRGAKMMREVLFNPNIPPRKEWVKPHLREE